MKNTETPEKPRKMQRNLEIPRECLRHPEQVIALQSAGHKINTSVHETDTCHRWCKNSVWLPYYTKLYVKNIKK